MLSVVLMLARRLKIILEIKVSLVRSCEILDASLHSLSCQSILGLYTKKTFWHFMFMFIGVRAFFCQGAGGELFAQKILASCPDLGNSRKGVRVTQCTNIGL